MVTPQDLLSALANAYSLSRNTPVEGSAFAEAVETVGEIHGELGWLVVRIGDDGLSVGGEGVPDGSGVLGEFRSALEGAGIQELRLQRVMTPEVMEDFFGRLSSPPDDPDPVPSARFRGLEDQLGLSFRRIQADLSGMVGGVQGLFRSSSSVIPDSVVPGSELPLEGVSEPPVPVSPELDSLASDPPDLDLPDSDLRDSDSPDADWPDADSQLLVEDASTPRPSLPPELVEEIRTYLGGLDSDRAESAKRLRSRAEDLSKNRDVAALGELVQSLLEHQGDSPLDEEAVDLGREFVTPAVASHFVARLGSTKDQAEQGRLVSVISRIGREGALALSDALEESRDRSQRRAFMGAMSAMGPHGLECAQRMVEDSRWFVVRNGVALLGEMGEEGSITYLTGTLANGDSRVRKETILSLAKLGGVDAETLVMGMLDDGDRGVRASACRALGVLRSPRSVRPLMGVLRDKDAEVQIECLQALGQIGDPGVVRTIEKRAFGGLFSKPATEIRLAAFRALAAIGTYGALRALEKGAKDSDPKVRSVVKTLIKKS
jgi:HEAT repeat protein